MKINKHMAKIMRSCTKAVTGRYHCECPSLRETGAAAAVVRGN